MEFALPLSAWRLRFEPEALQVIRSKIQSKQTDVEAVGQIYSSDITGDVVSISIATVLKAVKTRRTGVTIDKTQAGEERKKLFAQGLHCVGIWHSHPEAVPEPSIPDTDLAKDYAKAAAEQVTGVIFVIIGTAEFPDGLGVWMHDGQKLQEMTLVAQV
jgi:proteasome lid subunit RPN8/RPN11